MAFFHFLVLFSISICGTVEGGGAQQSGNLTGITSINHDLYHSSANLLKKIRSVVHRYPDKLKIETIPASNNGYSADITVVTYNKNQTETQKNPVFRVLISFGQHGRELITSEVALRILSILSEEHFNPNISSKSLKNTLSSLVLKIVPMENINGRKLVEEGNFCERKNGRGVDLNRNWSVDWGKKEKDYDPFEENPGTAPFSEPETQIMRKIALSFKPHMWVNVHSGMEALFTPYDYKNTTPQGTPSHKMGHLLNEVNRLHFQKRCIMGSGGSSVGYLAHGTATDYMYDVVKVPMAFTFEIYGDETASSNDCFKMFNPTDKATFNRVVDDWSSAFFSLFELGHGEMEANEEKWVSIDEYLDGYLLERRNRYEKKAEVLEVGMQEIRTYFRLFLLSSVLLLFMFCSRITKTKLRAIAPLPL